MVVGSACGERLFAWFSLPAGRQEELGFAYGKKATTAASQQLVGQLSGAMRLQMMHVSDDIGRCWLLYCARTIRMTHKMHRRSSDLPF